MPVNGLVVEAEAHVGKGGGSFEAYSVELVGIEAESAQDGGRNLVGSDRGADSVGVERRIRKQEHDVGIVMRKAAVLGQFGGAAGIGDTDVGGDDDVGSARIVGGQSRHVVVEREAGAVIDLADARGFEIAFQSRHGRCCVRGVGEPQDRDVILGGADAVGIRGDSDIGRRLAISVAGDVPLFVFPGTGR